MTTDNMGAGEGLTAALARFIAQPPIVQMPAQAAEIVRSGFIDTIATTIAGRAEPVTELVRKFVAARAGASPADATSSLLFGQGSARSVDAALVNGTAGHALDYDDVALAGHPSTVLVPAVLAEAERLGLGGADAMRAYLVGYEVWAELLSRDPDPYHVKGWHPTAVLGTVGAAAAVAHLNRLSAPVCAHAIAIAASMASGLVSNFGAMTKPLHAGRAAACGIEAVQLAVAGLTAAPDAIEHHAGYLAALSPKGRADRASPAASLGSTLRILDSGLSIKKYPMCYATHRVIDGVLDLAKAHGVAANDVKAVVATVGPAQASMLRNHDPRTGLEAKFSLEFAVASALVARSVGLSELTDSFVARDDVRATMPKVQTTVVDTQCPVEPVFAMHDRVVLELADGRKLDSGEIRFARGNAKLPMKLGDLRTKFLDCVAQAKDLDGAALFDALSQLDTLDDVRTLARQPAARRAA